MQPQHRSQRIRLAQVALALVTLVAAALRLTANDGPFSSSDHAEAAAIALLFFPRAGSWLIPGSGLWWQIFTSSHGALTPLVAQLWAALLGITGQPLNEWRWNAPFALLGVVGVLLAGRLAARLHGVRAGVLASALLAVLPVHVALSRASGLSHIPLMSLCQLLACLALLSYASNPTPNRAWRAGLLLALALSIEIFFPLLLTAAALTLAIAGSPVGTPLRERVARARTLARAPGLALPALGALLIGLGIIVGHRLGHFEQGGPMGRLFEGSDRRAGLYLLAFATNLSFAVGPIVAIALPLMALGGIGWLRRLDARCIPLVWSAVYLVPFALFTRPNVYGYFLMGLVWLTIAAALALANIAEREPASPRATRAWQAMVVALIAVLALRSLTIIGAANLGPLVGRDVAQGGIFPDQGLKAAAAWVRQRATPDDVVFADTAFEPYQLFYYVKPPFLGFTDTVNPEDGYRRIASEPTRPRFFLVVPGNEPLLLRYATPAPPLLAMVTEGDRTLLLIYGDADDGGAPPVERVDRAVGNALFDAEDGSLTAMLSAR